MVCPECLAAALKYRVFIPFHIALDELGRRRPGLNFVVDRGHLHHDVLLFKLECLLQTSFQGQSVPSTLLSRR